MGTVFDHLLIPGRARAHTHTHTHTHTHIKALFFNKAAADLSVMVMTQHVIVAVVVNEGVQTHSYCNF